MYYDVILSHEWGGLLAPLAAAMYYRQLRPGMRLAIQPRGGHVWARSWKADQWLGVQDLRVDNQVVFPIPMFLGVLGGGGGGLFKTRSQQLTLRIVLTTVPITG